MRVNGKRVSNVVRESVNSTLLYDALVTGHAKLYLDGGGLVHALEVATVQGPRFVYLDRNAGAFVLVEVP